MKEQVGGASPGSMARLVAAVVLVISLTWQFSCTPPDRWNQTVIGAVSSQRLIRAQEETPHENPLKALARAARVQLAGRPDGPLYVLYYPDEEYLTLVKLRRSNGQHALEETVHIDRNILFNQEETGFMGDEMPVEAVTRGGEVEFWYFHPWRLELVQYQVDTGISQRIDFSQYFPEHRRIGMAVAQRMLESPCTVVEEVHITTIVFQQCVVTVPP